VPHILRLKYLFAHYLYPTASPSSLLKMAPRLHIPKRLEDMSFPADEILLAVFFFVWQSFLLLELGLVDAPTTDTLMNHAKAS